MLKLSIITLFLGPQANRFLQYQESRSTGERLDLIGKIDGCDGVELRYPADFGDLGAIKAGLDRNGLAVSAINFASVRPGKWMRGAWTSENPADRREAVDDFKRAVDIAFELDANRLTNCPLNDGVDYAWEIDFPAALDRAAECYAEVAAHNRDARICIEYKISEPRVRSLFGNAGETAAFCQMVGADNLGVTLDIGHSLQAYENPAAAAALLARAKRLFYVHLNDNDGRADWDLMPGSNNIWQITEFLDVLRDVGYDDWCTYDVVPKEMDPVEFFTSAVRITRKLEALSERVDRQTMTRLREERNPGRTMDYLFSLL